MENASKALLLAGGVLLMIIVLSLATLIINRMGSQTSDFYQKMSETRIYEFNQQFFNYNEKNDLRIQDVVTLVNLAKDSNAKGVAPVEVKVICDGIQLQNSSSKDITSMLSSDMDSKFSCIVKYADNSNYVGEVRITKNKT